MHDHSSCPSKGSPVKVLLISIVITLAFAVVEAVTGWYAHSLTLMSDAGHMAADSFSLMLAASAAWISLKPPSPKHSYGFGRAEVIGAWLSSLLIILIVIGIVYEAFQRFSHLEPIDSSMVIIVGVIGMIVNISVAFVLSRGNQNLNTRAAVLHVMSDLLGSVAAVISGIVIHYTHWMSIDPLLSLFISVLIFISGVRLLRETIHILMEGVPNHISLEDVGNALAELPAVISVHDLHIWTLSTGNIALSAHLLIHKMKEWNEVLIKAQVLLKAKFSITHVTLQPELDEVEIKAFNGKPQI